MQKEQKESKWARGSGHSFTSYFRGIAVYEYVLTSYINVVCFTLSHIHNTHTLPTRDTHPIFISWDPHRVTFDNLSAFVLFSTVLYFCKGALQRKSHLCILTKGIAQPRSQFPHSSACERFIYSQDWSPYSFFVSLFLLQETLWTNPGNI